MGTDEVLVIGAGLGGLAAGILLQANGYQATILEAAPGPGGVALTRWGEGDTIEGGVYFFMEHAPGMAAYALYEALGLVPAADIVTVERYLHLYDERSGARLDVTRDLDALERDLLALAPEDGALVRTLVAGARSFAFVDPVKMGFEKPPELQGLLDKLSLGWHARKVAAVMMKKSLFEWEMPRWLAPAKSEALKTLLLNVFPQPTIAPWFLMMLLGLLARGQLGRLAGSADALVGRLAARYRALGGRAEYDTPVRRIVVEDGRAVGVELADGVVRRAHAVVYTADTAQLHRVLLEGAFLAGDAVASERLARWPVSPPGAFVHFVTAGAWPDQPWLQQVIPAAPFVTGERACALVSVRFFDPGVAGAGAGESVVQVGFETDLAYWSEPAQRADRARAVVARVQADVDRWVPGFAARVLRAEVATPEVYQRVLRAPDGVTGAWLPTSQALMSVSPRRVPGVAGLYLAGQWAVAGAGILAVLYSGSHAAQLACHDDGRRFALAPGAPPA